MAHAPTGWKTKSFNHEAHEEQQGLEREMVFGAVVPAKAGTQGLRGASGFPPARE